MKYFLIYNNNVTLLAKKQRSKEKAKKKQRKIKEMDTCTGCKSVNYIVGSKEHSENLHFDEQTKSWWCYGCCGYAEVRHNETDNLPVVSIITREVIKK